MGIESIILCGVIIFLGLVNLYERRQANNREKDLLNRLMARSLDEYAANSIMTSPPEYIGETSQPEDVIYPVD